MNPVHTYRELMQQTLADLEINGNAYWLISRGALTGVPNELWHVPAPWMSVVPAGRGDEDEGVVVSGYTLRRGTTEVRLARGDVVHFRYPNPAEPFYGASPLAAALDAIFADEAVARAQRATFENGPMPGVIFTPAEPMTADQQARFRATFESNFRGSDMAGRMIITPPARVGDKLIKPELKPFTTTPREMDFVESARATRDRILGVFGVPPAVLGLIEVKSESAVKTAQTLFARDTLLPKLKLVAARITQDICTQVLPAGLQCSFTNPIPEDRKESRDDLDMLLRHNVISRDEARAHFPDLAGTPAPTTEGNV